jgi:hypothetical protein
MYHASIITQISLTPDDHDVRLGTLRHNASHPLENRLWIDLIFERDDKNEQRPVAITQKDLVRHSVLILPAKI